MKNYFKIISIRAIRVALVFISFTIDIKVRADVHVHMLKGQVDIEKDGKLLETQDVKTLQEPLDIQTSNKSLAKVQVNSIYIGADEKSFASFNTKPKLELMWGRFMIWAPQRDGLWLTISTPQGEISTAGGECVVEIADGKTKLSVTYGEMRVRDRASQKTQHVRVGYSYWIGGLKSDGTRASGELNSFDFDTVMASIKNLSRMNQEEWQSRYDTLKPQWKAAVEEIAKSTQAKVLDDIAKYNVHADKIAEQVSKDKKEDAMLRRRFRARALALPDENPEVPSVLPRSPASAD